MKLDDKRYQLGSYVDVKGIGMLSITAISMENVKVSNGEELPWHYIKPVDLSEQLMKEIGFEMIKKTNNSHHIDVNMSIKIMGRFYFTRGIVYENKSMWSFYGAGIKYLHQLQQIVWIIDPSYEFNLGS